MTLPYYMPSVGTSGSSVPAMQYYQNSAGPIPLVQQFQGNQNMHRPPYQYMQDMFNPQSHGYANIPKPYIPRYPTVAPNMFGAQPSLDYHGFSMPISHMTNMIYPNVPMRSPQEYPPAPGRSYLSQLKSAADCVAASDSLGIPDSTTAQEGPTILGNNSLTDVIVIPDDTPDQEINTTQAVLDVRGKRGSDLSLAADPILGQEYVFREDYQPGPGQLYISKIRSLVEGVPFDDPRFYINYPKKSRSGASSTSQLSDIQGEPPVPTERKKRRNKRKATSTDTNAKKPRTKTKSPSNLSSDNAPLNSSENKIDKSCEYDLAYFSKNPRSDWYPRPVSTNCEYLYIGRNGTFVPTSFYTTITWESFEESTRILLEFIFGDGTLATHSLDGDYRLDPDIVQDVVTHVAEKCSVKEESVRSAISMLCADASLTSLGFS